MCIRDSINDEDDDRSDNHSNNSDAVITMAQAKEIALKEDVYKRQVYNAA